MDKVKLSQFQFDERNILINFYTSFLKKNLHLDSNLYKLHFYPFLLIYENAIALKQNL